MADIDELAAEVKQWLVDHVASFVAARNLKPIQVWEDLPDESAFINNRLKFPAIAVMTDGLAEAPERDGRKGYDTVWRILVSVWVAAPRSQQDAVELTRQYTIAIRNCLLSAKRSDWVWVGERYAGIDDQRLSGLIGFGTTEMNVRASISFDGLNPGPVDPVPVVTNILVDVDFKKELN